LKAGLVIFGSPPYHSFFCFLLCFFSYPYPACTGVGRVDLSSETVFFPPPSWGSDCSPPSPLVLPPILVVPSHSLCSTSPRLTRSMTRKTPFRSGFPLPLGQSRHHPVGVLPSTPIFFLSPLCIPSRPPLFSCRRD